MEALLSLTGCNLDYSLDKDSDPSTLVDTDSVSDSQAFSCPKGLELESAIEFTQTIACSFPAQEYLDTCPDGQALIGFTGFLTKADLLHARIKGICGIPSIETAEDQCVVSLERGSDLPVRGSVGEIEWSRMCPENEFIIGFKAWTGSNIDQIAFRCAPLALSREGTDFTLSRGPFTDLETVGDNDGYAHFQQDCPEGQFATTTRLQADAFLRAVGLGCQSPSLL